jgi:hypothetical protein
MSHEDLLCGSKFGPRAAWRVQRGRKVRGKAGGQNPDRKSIDLAPLLIPGG